jgi:cytidylate kinase
MAKSIPKIMEEQIGQWRLEVKGRARRRRAEHRVVPADVVAISSAYGPLGQRIATMVGEQLRVPVYDRAIVEHIAKTARVRVATVETLDERAQGAIDDYLTALVREKAFNQNEYLKALSETIAALWKHGPCVFVGHAASHLIPREHRLAVRIVAPADVRTKRVAQMGKLDLDQARRVIARKDAERASFIRRLFGTKIDDPLGYDLVINTAAMTAPDCAAIIVDAYRRSFPRRASA